MLTAAIERVRPINLQDIQEARQRIAGTAIRTPLIKLELGAGFPEIRLKLENLQPINAYKLRGAANAVAMLSEEERKRGVWTISAGNAGQGVAYAARKAGVTMHRGRTRDRAGGKDRTNESVGSKTCGGSVCGSMAGPRGSHISRSGRHICPSV